MSENRLQLLSIFGREIPIRTQERAEEVSEIAASVDARMREMAEAARIKDPLRIAILTSLNYAGEAHSQRREALAREERLKDLVRRIDRCLAEERTPQASANEGTKQVPAD